MPSFTPPLGHEAAPEASPWLAIVGIGEDGLAGLSPAARAALDGAELVFGGPRHLALAQVGMRGKAWPQPFDLAPLLALRGRRVAVLASGDPFWFGVGGSLSRHLAPAEWRAFPGASCFSLACARLGWRIEDVACRGLHAAPFEVLAADLAPGARLLVTLRDGAAVAALAEWLAVEGWGASTLTAMQALGGPDEAVATAPAHAFAAAMRAPVLAAITCKGGEALPLAPGLPEAAFAHDGQITKARVRALTLAALAPQRGDMLWDLGAGSGSVSVEWCRLGGRAVAVETRPDRCANIAENARRFGLGARLAVRQGDSLAQLPTLPAPDAIFVGGGFDAALFTALRRAAPQARLVVNAVTLTTQALLTELHARHGGALWRIDLAQAAPLGPGHGWQAARSVMQWSLP